VLANIVNSTMKTVMWKTTAYMQVWSGPEVLQKIAVNLSAQRTAANLRGCFSFVVQQYIKFSFPFSWVLLRPLPE
jgi:hypothetical protein